jgi:flagellar biosynthesis protein FlhF
MYVRKFEADTLEEALKDIKRELGPDAIILKTMTNKGLKGAFKKKKIEITAAISEKNYTRKANVDKSLGENYQEQFYDNNSTFISNMIDQHSENRKLEQRSSVATNNAGAAGYGQLGLNKAVVQARNSAKEMSKDLTSKIKNSLDDFLNFGNQENSFLSQDEDHYESYEEEAYQQVPQRPANRPAVQQQAQAPVRHVETVSSADGPELEYYKKKIDALEKQVYELTRGMERVEKREPEGIYQLRTTLKSLDINDRFIQEVTRKSLFELSQSEVQNPDTVFDFALREMLERVRTDMPLFSSTDLENGPVVTVLVSESAVGQTSMLRKLGALKADCVLIRNNKSAREGQSFTDSMFGLNVIDVKTIAEIVSECRKAIEAGKSVFVDFKNTNTETVETKKFIDGLKRSFNNVEVLICLSAIHSELYNKKVISKYRGMAQGIVVNQLDLCLNYGSLFNIIDEVPSLPFKFYGTGEIVPDDLEAATAERILAGIFQLD